LYLRMY